MNCTADTEQFELPMLNYYLFRFIAEATVSTPDTAGIWIWYFGDRFADFGVSPPGGLRLIEMPEMWRFGEQNASVMMGSSVPTMSKELS